MLKNNPMVKRIVETGEERVGKLTQQLMSNETFVTAVQVIRLLLVLLAAPLLGRWLTGRAGRGR